MSERPNRPYIVYDGVEVQYTPLVHGLRGVSLTINQGEFVFLVGKSGSGKSTMLKLLSREVQESTGSVQFHGKLLSTLKDRDIPYLRRQMGIVPQDFALLPKKRVWENVAYAMRAVGHSRRTVIRKVPQILDMVHIGHRADAFPHELSGGEQQRVAIARALINEPDLLIADEPTGNLDPENSCGIMDLLSELNTRGATVIVASHDVATIETMNRRVVELREGLIVRDQPPISAVHRALEGQPESSGQVSEAIVRTISSEYVGPSRVSNAESAISLTDDSVLMPTQASLGANFESEPISEPEVESETAGEPSSAATSTTEVNHD